MKTIRDTPVEVIEILLKKAELSRGCHILEPSAGNGAILEELAKYSYADSFSVDAVELNDEKFRHIDGKLKNDLLKHKFLHYVAFHSDFLKFSEQQTIAPYDRIIAAPPFKDNVDLAHIKAMYKLLISGGILVALTTPYWVINNEEHQVKFRNWLVGKHYNMTMLPDNSFIEKNRTVPTAVIKIWK